MAGSGISYKESYSFIREWFNIKYHPATIRTDSRSQRG